ncbi:hypothetical protein MWH28_12150 [Natroniella sulfidigena]|uniref:hypothetical protein n=1 Tax=Natroniella sulfidigena TaxID=723921 RepID=UPI00200A0DA0|nr:hypothetical protein [Natroniella sulfidigena]MCK8818108.1 hypothetical protein [Natroniella sulfidigena]
MSNDDNFNLRADLVANKETMPKHILEWLEKKYRNHTGSNRAFVRSLVVGLYEEEQTKKEKLKREIIDELLEKIGSLDIQEREKVEEGLKELDDNQVSAQESILDQFS